MASNEIVPLKPKQKRRLYEPVIMYKSLTEITHEEGALRHVEVPERPRTEEQRYHYFLHRIASVCDSTKSGKTVTSVTVLEREERFEYVVGCNQVFGSDLDAMQHYVAELLRKLSGFSSRKSNDKGAVRSAILKMILVFNLPRTDFYLREFKKQLAECVQYCERQSDTIAHTVGRGLKTFQRAISDTAFKDLGDEQYLEAYNGFIQALTIFLTAETTAYLEERASKGRFNDGKSFECWSELRHSLSRLRNYKRIVQDLIDAENEWPELFQEFVVTTVESSRAEANPMGKKSETAQAIIGRMCSDEASRNKYCSLAQNLQVMDLDGRIQNQCTKPSFRPYVHAEILVLEWIVAEIARSDVQFFRHFRYIGSSKGACQLCRYYFDVPGQHDRIATRPSHGNLYINWRLPDLKETDGSFAKTRRQKIYDSMIDKIREDALGILVSRSSEGRRHDSSTHPLMSVRHTDVQTDLGARELPDVDELGEDLARALSLGASDSDSDDDDGGISLVM
ncbi:hypothetical protein F66182_7863 [Fusarium sp. NRRL 66182]|nr:hypothetical protein F66182_7863 [Fusarium sp. NRRL 66182]